MKFFVLFVIASLSQISEQGKTIFQQKCASCHTIGKGNLVGPDLKGVFERREKDWIRAFISDPIKMISEGDPIATKLLEEFNNIQMPSLGLSDEELDSVIAFLESGETTAEQVSIAQAQEEGDPNVGKKLFNGEIALQNGGPSCIACHNLSESSGLGWGKLGPDLTQAVAKFGDAGFISVLSQIPFPTMSL